MFWQSCQKAGTLFPAHEGCFTETNPMPAQQSDDAVGGANSLANRVVVKCDVLFEDHSVESRGMVNRLQIAASEQLSELLGIQAIVFVGVLGDEAVAARFRDRDVINMRQQI